MYEMSKIGSENVIASQIFKVLWRLNWFVNARERKHRWKRKKRLNWGCSHQMKQPKTVEDYSNKELLEKVECDFSKCTATKHNIKLQKSVD